MNLAHKCSATDCPQHTGGKCQTELGHTIMEVIRELRVIRGLYDQFESDHLMDSIETPPREFVTWRGWKMVKNVITDRIEELSGSRV